MRYRSVSVRFPFFSPFFLRVCSLFRFQRGDALGKPSTLHLHTPFFSPSCFFFPRFAKNILPVLLPSIYFSSLFRSTRNQGATYSSFSHYQAAVVAEEATISLFLDIASLPSGVGRNFRPVRCDALITGLCCCCDCGRAAAAAAAGGVVKSAG